MSSTNPTNPTTKRRPRERGSILTITVIMLMIIMGVALMTSTLAQNDHSHTYANLSKVLVVSKCTGASDVASDYIITQISAQQPVFTASASTMPAINVGGLQFPFLATFPVQGMTTPGYTIVQLDTSLNSLGPMVQDNTKGVTTTTGGYSAYATLWKIWVWLPQVDGRDPSGTVRYSTTVVNKMLSAGSEPVFQYAVFYNKADLEIDNGPPFTLSGKVHTNQDMYLSPSSSLTFDTSHIAAAGKFAGSRGDQTVQGGQVYVTIPPTNPDGTVPSGQTTKQWPSGGSVPSGQTAMSSGTGTIEGSNHSNFYADLNTAFGGAAKDPVTDGGNGNPPASKVAFPNISTNTGLDQTTLKYTSGSQYENEAGLKVYTDSLGAVHAFDSTNTEITSKLPAGAITTGSFWDNREGKQVTTIDVDLGKLNAVGSDGVNHYPTNGLIYGVNDPSVGAISGSPPSGGSSPLTSGNAIRLTDGAALPVTNDGKGGNGLTVVTPGALYVEGDMNTTSTGGPKMATISDSLNLLSNNWKTSGQDAATTSSHKDNNAATNTTYNMSFVTGNQASVGTSYGGGLENFPRFLENWSGITCTISGSMVCDTHSKIATGAWGQANVYTPPNRNWSYDRGLVSARPPFVPVTTSVVATVYWVK